MKKITIKSTTTKLALSFVFIGIIALLFRIILTVPDSIPAGDSAWELTMSVNTTDDKKPTIYLAVPFDSVSNRVISQTFTHPGFDLKRVTQRKDVSAREVVAVAREKGKLTLTGSFKIQISQNKRWQKWLKGSDVFTPEDRMKFLEISPELQLNEGIFGTTLKSLAAGSSSQELFIENIFNFTHRKILSNNAVAFDTVEKVLTQKQADALGKASVMIALCRASNIPARLVTGVIVEEMLDVDEHYWVDVFSNDGWKSYDPSAGYSGEVPATYLKLKENNAQLAYQNDGLPLEVTIDIEQIPMPAGLMGVGEKRFSNIIDLTRLPVSTQLLLSSLLLLPFGALLTVLFRSIIGVQTFGTFTSSLLALSVIHADWVTVLVVVGLVTSIGVGGRSLLPKKISRIPRLSIVLTIVAISMVFSVSLMDYYNLNPSLSVVLLPVIVLANLVDRFYAVTDEKGLAIAIYRLFWTCLVAGVCYILFIIEELGQYLVIYPEIHFFTLALILFCSAYKMKMLSDLVIFQWMKEPKHTTNRDNSNISVSTESVKKI